MFKKTIKYGSKGIEVEQLQDILNIYIDGIFGTETHLAVKKFQVNNGLKSDGIVGEKTWEKLYGLETDFISASNNLFEKYHLPINEYSKNKTYKEYIFLHHTSGWENPYNTIDGWANDNRGMIGTEFVIGGKKITNDNSKYDGKILQAFPQGHYAWHLGSVKSHFMHKSSIGIELCNFGYLDNGKTYTGRIAKKTQIDYLEEEFRGYNQWHKYSDKQIESLRNLLLYIAERDNIQVNEGLPELIKEKGVKAFEYIDRVSHGVYKGVWSHSNVRKDKTDCYPQKELMDMLVGL